MRADWESLSCLQGRTVEVTVELTEAGRLARVR